MSSEGQPAAADAAGDDSLARIRAALDRLTADAPNADQPLNEIATGLDGLHQQLQAALTGLDQA